VIIVMEWTLFEFIRARQFGAALAVRGPLMMMMHEDWGAAQNYVVADAGEVLISHPMKCAWAGLGSR
jgi:hypothetical protein